MNLTVIYCSVFWASLMPIYAYMKEIQLYLSPKVWDQAESVTCSFTDRRDCVLYLKDCMAILI